MFWKTKLWFWGASRNLYSSLQYFCNILNILNIFVGYSEHCCRLALLQLSALTVSAFQAGVRSLAPVKKHKSFMYIALREILTRAIVCERLTYLTFDGLV